MRYSVVQPRVDAKTPAEEAPPTGAGALVPSEEAPSEAPRVSVPRPRSERPRSPKSSPKSKAPAAAAAAPTIPASRGAGAPASPAAATLPAAQRSEAPASQSPLDAVEDKELVVTVALSDWNLPSRDALVGHGAVRVAIAPGRGSGGTLMVRPLKPGEVAPRGSTIAVLVTLEQDSPLPRV